MKPISDDIQRIVVTAFTLEAISNKDECTTRYIDLPGKPLEDFLIAGINVGRHFRYLADDVQVFGNRVEIFHHFVPALQESNANKSSKFVNFGLLEAMFATVAARLLASSGNEAITLMTQLFDREMPADVHHLLEARTLAWSTSTNTEKRNFDDAAFHDLPSVTNFYKKLSVNFGPDTSNHQWGMHAHDGFPILQKTYDALRDSTNILETIPIIHRSLRAEYPTTRIGILADYFAAAIFLRLYDHL